MGNPQLCKAQRIFMSWWVPACLGFSTLNIAHRILGLELFFFIGVRPLWNWTRIWIVANYGLFDSSVLWGFFRIWEIAYHGSRRQAVVTFYCPFNSTLQRSKRKIKWPQKSKVPRDWANVELSLMLCHLSIELFFSRGLLCSLGAMPWAFNF